MYKFFMIIPIIILSIISCTTKVETPEEDSMFLRILIGDKYGFMNESGKIVIEPQYDDAGYYFSEGLCFAKQDKKTGLINKDGMFAVELPDSIDWVEPFKNGIAKVYVKKKVWHSTYAIDTLGNYILNGQEIYRINEDGNDTYIIINQEYNQYNIFDLKGNKISGSWEDLRGGFSDGLCAVAMNEKWGYIDTTGKLVIDTVFDVASEFSDGIAWVLKDSITYAIGRSGQKLFVCDEPITRFSCNRAIVKQDNAIWLVDRIGKKICELHLDEKENHGLWRKSYQSDSLMSLVINGKASKIDTMGNVVLSTNFSGIGEFINGIAHVWNATQEGYIKENGDLLVLEPICRDIYTNLYFSNSIFHYQEFGMRALETKNGLAYFDLTGKLIGKDMPLKKATIPVSPDCSREDYVSYFDSNLSDLDSIEGIYYVTKEEYWQSREDSRSYGLNNSSSLFIAVIKDNKSSEYKTYYTSNGISYDVKFVRIGDSNIYAILPQFYDSLSEGKMVIEDSSNFSFRLEEGHNSGYNFFRTYDFIKDYPPVSVSEKINKGEWYGTGFAIAEGYIATSYHVTSGAKSLFVRGVNGDMNQRMKSVVVASDKELDLAILRIVDKDYDSLGEIPYSFGKVNAEIGDEISVLGYPSIETMDEEIKMTKGKISSSTSYKGSESLYQISASLQPGNSGGPLFNKDGAVIGIICAKHSNTENVNYAVKVSYLYSLVNASDLGINIGKDKIYTSKLKVKEVRDFVYLIECYSR